MFKYYFLIATGILVEPRILICLIGFPLLLDLWSLNKNGLTHVAVMFALGSFATICCLLYLQQSIYFGSTAGGSILKIANAIAFPSYLILYTTMSESKYKWSASPAMRSIFVLFGILALSLKLGILSTISLNPVFAMNTGFSAVDPTYNSYEFSAAAALAIAIPFGLAMRSISRIVFRIRERSGTIWTRRIIILLFFLLEASNLALWLR